jgi:hypothetical protein
MPRYIAKTNLFVGGSRVRAGQEFHSDDKPGRNWQLAETAKPAPAAESPERRVKQPDTTAPKEKPEAKQPVIDPWVKYTDQQLRDFIDTKKGKQPGKDASRETLIARCKELVGAGGDS